MVMYSPVKLEESSQIGLKQKTIEDDWTIFHTPTSQLLLNAQAPGPDEVPGCWTPPVENNPLKQQKTVIWLHLQMGGHRSLRSQRSGSAIDKFLFVFDQRMSQSLVGEICQTSNNS
jgi:hypothetical protein